MIESTLTLAGNMSERLPTKDSFARFSAAYDNARNPLNLKFSNAKHLFLFAMRMDEDIWHYSDEAMSRNQR